MRRFRLPALPLAALLALAGCSGGIDAPSTQLQVLDAAREALARRGRPQSAPQITPETLAKIDFAFLEATRERTGQTAYLTINRVRRDDEPGQIAVWRTEDDVTLATRNGVLIATRGLGGDVLSSHVQVAGDRPGPSGSGPKVQYIRALDNKAVPMRLDCRLADLGPEPVVIVGQRRPTRHLRETCIGTGTRGQGQVVNDYWVDSAAELVWQSRQWAGPEIGYLTLRQLTN